MEQENLNIVEEKVKDSQEDRKTEIVDVDLTTLPEVKSEFKELIDYESYRLKLNKIESAEVVRIPSKFAVHKDGKQHKLRILGTVVEEVEVEDPKTKEKNTYEFRPSALLGMVEDEDGKLKGFPEAEGSGWGELKKTLNITKVAELVGKELPIKITQKNKDSPKFLGFMLA